MHIYRVYAQQTMYIEISAESQQEAEREAKGYDSMCWELKGEPDIRDIPQDICANCGGEDEYDE